MSLTSTTAPVRVGATRGHTGGILYVQAVHESAAIAASLAACGLAIDAVGDAAAAVQALRRERFVLAVVHLADERAGVATVRALRMQAPHLPVVALMDPARPLAAAEAIRAGASDLLTLPLDPHDLGALVANALDRASVGLSIDDPPIPAARDAVVANSAAMRAAVDQIQAAAGDPRGVLIVGEPGTGRTLLARMLHARSPRAGQRFVILDCRTSSPTDLELRLFGAVDKRAGGPERRATERLTRTAALHRASGGTLFLQHLVEAPSRVQARLARLLRDREAVLNEDRSYVEIDVRLVASVDAGLEPDLDDRLRRDLLDRIAHWRVDAPAFRRRREDIPVIATWTLHDQCERHGVPQKALSRAALVTLSALPWVGNGPELVAVLETLACRSNKPVVQVEDLFEHVRLDGLAPRIDAGGSLRDARARFEREWISSVLIKHHGRVGDAAKALGIQRTNLYRKVRQLKIARTLLAPRKTNL